MHNRKNLSEQSDFRDFFFNVKELCKFGNNKKMILVKTLVLEEMFRFT